MVELIWDMVSQVVVDTLLESGYGLTRSKSSLGQVIPGPALALAFVLRLRRLRELILLFGFNNARAAAVVFCGSGGIRLISVLRNNNVLTKLDMVKLLLV